MIVLPRPLRSANDDYDGACAQPRAPKAAHLRALRDQVLQAYDRYEAFVRDLTAATAIPMTAEQRSALHLAYADTYDGRRLEDLRDELLISARAIDEDCPICQSGRITQLDHFLPKAHFPEFSILALNLVPVCGDCNKDKGDAVDLVTGSSYFHHYLDVLPQEPVLIATPVLRPGQGKSIRFSLADVRAGESPGTARYRHQFKQLGLALRLLTRATKDMTQANAQNERIVVWGGAAGVRREMLHRAADNEQLYGPNHWLTAMYTGLGNSAEYCSSFESSEGQRTPAP